MRTYFRTVWLILVVAIVSCSSGIVDSEPDSGVADSGVADADPVSGVTDSGSGGAPSATQVAESEGSPSTPTELPSPLPILVPEFTVGDVEILVTRADRDVHGLKFWPDGSLGVLPAEGGQYVFYAANGPLSARSVGPLDNPLAQVDTADNAIQGIDPQYAYASGGPVYRDPETGAILKVYHIEIEAGPERTEGDYSRFYTLLGLAVSLDGGNTFQDLGEIVRPEWEQGMPTQGGLIISTSGGGLTIAEGYFYLYFEDFPAEGGVHELVAARAPVEQVVQAALEGRNAEWLKYYDGEFSEPGLGGKTTPLELGNPGSGWMDVSYNNFMDAFLLVLADYTTATSANLYMTTSPDGIHWSPRVALTSGDYENMYPTIIGLDGDTLVSGESFYVYNAYSAIGGVNRWQDASLVRRLVTLTGMVEAPHDWQFETDGDTEGWRALNQIENFVVSGGNLMMRSTGSDPYMSLSGLAIRTESYPTLEITMRASGGTGGQVFFTTDTEPLEGEDKSRRFDIIGDGEFHTYTLDMSLSFLWQGIVTSLRIDPVQTEGIEIEIDSIVLSD